MVLVSFMQYFLRALCGKDFKFKHEECKGLHKVHKEDLNGWLTKKIHRPSQHFLICIFIAVYELHFQYRALLAFHEAVGGQTGKIFNLPEAIYP